MSEEDAWLQVMEITYHNQEKIVSFCNLYDVVMLFSCLNERYLNDLVDCFQANVIKYVRGEEGEKFMKSESISKIVGKF